MSAVFSAAGSAPMSSSPGGLPHPDVISTVSFPTAAALLFGGGAKIGAVTAAGEEGRGGRREGWMMGEPYQLGKGDP